MLVAIQAIQKGDKVARYVLPELRYDYGALEPHVSARIMELHHGKHHAAYVKNANTALERLEEARETGDFQGIEGLLVISEAPVSR